MVTVPLAPRTARAVDLAIGERLSGPIFIGADGRRFDRHIAGRVVRRVARRAGVNKPIGPHTLRHAFITAALDAGVPLRDVQEAASRADAKTTMRYDEPGSLLTATLPTSSPRTSPGPVVRNKRCSGRLSAKADAQAALSSVRGIAVYFRAARPRTAFGSGRGMRCSVPQNADPIAGGVTSLSSTLPQSDITAGGRQVVN